MAEDTAVDTTTAADTSTSTTTATDTTTVDTTTTNTDTTSTATDTTTTNTDTSTATDTTSTDTDTTDDAGTDKPLGWAELREKYAKGDDKLSKRLSRYSSPEAVIDALIAAQNKIASGNLKEVLPENPTDEQLTAWREANGIPAAPTDYEVKLDQDVIIGEADAPAVDEFLKTAHGLNLRPDQVNETLNWYFKHQEAQIEALNQRDSDTQEEATETLREEWGSEFKLNKNLILNMFDTAPEGVKDLLLGARLADGTALGNHAPTLRFLANLSRELNPVATIVPGSGMTAPQAIETELATITKLMGDPKSEYWKGPGAEKMQERYRTLIDAQTKYNK